MERAGGMRRGHRLEGFKTTFATIVPPGDGQPAVEPAEHIHLIFPRSSFIQRSAHSERNENTRSAAGCSGDDDAAA